MCLYLEPCCPNRPTSEELSAVEVNSRIQSALDVGANLNPQASPTPLQERVDSARVSTLGLILVAYAILHFHCFHGFAQGLGGGHKEPRDANPPVDVARLDVNHAFNGKAQAQREREREQA
jgi:hypothetical protein